MSWFCPRDGSRFPVLITGLVLNPEFQAEELNSLLKNINITL